MSAKATAAVLLATEMGLPVFPCRARDEIVGSTLRKAKSPLTERGFYDATLDPELIQRLWPTSSDALIGVRTGGASGIYAIDVDTRGADWHTQNNIRLQPGRVHRTRRGHHLLYRSPGLGCTTGTLADGVDTRGDGGYIIWWPAEGLDAIGDMSDIGDLPAWVLDSLQAAEEKKVPRRSSDGGIAEDRSRDLMSRVGKDVRAGRADYEILAAHRQHPHARDQSDPDRAIQRCIDNCRSDRVTAPHVDQVHSSEKGKLRPDDFYAYLPEHKYIFVPSREFWAAASVNSQCEQPTNADGSAATKRVKQKSKGDVEQWIDVPVSPTEWLDQNQKVAQMTWAPGHPMVISDKLVSHGGWIDQPGCSVFNLYLPPQVREGDSNEAGPWVDHVEKVFDTEAAHIIKWLAHRVQRPGEKINHALVLGGGMGIGKDTLLEPLKYAVGAWNVSEVSPTHLLGRFNGFVKSVILRISEARDLGDVDRFAFYDHLKVYTAAPPDVLRCDEKNLREHSVMNVCGVIITTNYKTDGIYLPADDRRNYVAWSDLTKEDFSSGYWNRLYTWYANGGNEHVAAYLAAVDLTSFDPKAPPPKTAAFHEIVDANRAPEDAELADALDSLNDFRQRNGNAVPAPAITLQDVADRATTPEFREWLQDRRNRRQIPHRLESAGYVPIRNDADKHDGQWKVGGKRQTVYGRRELSIRDRIRAAQDLVKT